MPTNEVRAVLTQRGANALAQIQLGKITTTGLSFFRIGEGGYTLSGPTYFPKEPTNVQTVLDSDDPLLIPGITLQIGHTPYVFQKSFVPADLFVESTVIARANALIDFLEANDNGIGGAPEFFEIGFYIVNQITSVQVATGDGVAASFTFTAPSLPVNIGGFTVSSSSPVQVAADNGSGLLVPSPTPGTSGTINYQTGAVTVNWPAPPVIGDLITVTYPSTPLFLYGTFPVEAKTSLVQILKISRVSY
jgi:hypothetical protein